MNISSESSKSTPRKSNPRTSAIAENSAIVSVGRALAKIRAKLPTDSFVIDRPRISTGFLTLDTALGGGIVEGGVIEVFGTESCGKSTLGLQVLRTALTAPSHGALYLDFEQSFDPLYAETLTGIKCYPLDKAPERGPYILYYQPPDLETGVNVAFDLSEALGKNLRFILLDSLAAMTPKKIVEGEIGEVTVGLQARLLSQFFSVASKRFTRLHTTLWVLNQLRARIGGMSGFGAAPPTQSAGGHALKFFAWQRISISSGESHAWKAQLPAGSHIGYFKIEKNKTSPHRKGKTRLVIWPGRGFSSEIELLDLCIQHHVLQAKGSNQYTFNGKGPFSRGKLLTMLTASERKDEIREQLRQKLFEVVTSREFVYQTTEE